MLTLTCDRCGFSVDLIHRMEPKREDTDGGDGQGYRMFWELCNEQQGIGYSSKDNYFDYDPQELDKWDWHGNMGTYNKDGISGHFCHKCKEEYKTYIKNYQGAKVDLSHLQGLNVVQNRSVFNSTVKDIEKKMQEHRRAYINAFKKKK